MSNIFGDLFDDVVEVGAVLISPVPGVVKVAELGYKAVDAIPWAHFHTDPASAQPHETRILGKHPAPQAEAPAPHVERAETRILGKHLPADPGHDAAADPATPAPVAPGGPAGDLGASQHPVQHPPSATEHPITHPHPATGSVFPTHAPTHPQPDMDFGHGAGHGITLDPGHQMATHPGSNTDFGHGARTPSGHEQLTGHGLPGDHHLPGGIRTPDAHDAIQAALGGHGTLGGHSGDLHGPLGWDHTPIGAEHPQWRTLIEHHDEGHGIDATSPHDPGHHAADLAAPWHATLVG